MIADRELTAKRQRLIVEIKTPFDDSSNIGLDTQPIL
jgi:hypothetical protein